MAYEHKPGSFSLFKNDKGDNEKRPDYTGEGMDAWLHWLDHSMGAHHHHHDEPASEAAALRQRVQQLEAELARAKAALSADASA